MQQPVELGCLFRAVCLAEWQKKPPGANAVSVLSVARALTQCANQSPIASCGATLAADGPTFVLPVPPGRLILRPFLLEPRPSRGEEGHGAGNR